MFASFKFNWPPALITLYNSLSFSNFNIELLAPECSFSVDYATKWALTESIPLLLLVGVGVVLVGARLLQTCERRLLGRLPTGATSDVHLIDVCLGILLTGLYYTYFGGWLSGFVSSHDSCLCRLKCLDLLCVVSTSGDPHGTGTLQLCGPGRLQCDGSRAVGAV